MVRENTGTGTGTDQDHEIRKMLFHSAMKGDWKEVKQIYLSNRNVHKEKITKSKRTALHVAVSDGKEDVVVDLVNIICPAPEMVDAQNEAQKRIKAARDDAASRIDAAATEASIIQKDLETEISKIEEDLATQISTITEPLTIKDEEKNTPLHTAAELGNARVCYCIARRRPSLIGDRNRDGETPLFLAALHGHRDAFLCLQSICGSEGSMYVRRKDGETILHCSISGDYFDLAFQIIHHYPNLVNFFNERGQSPLHLLAARPSAFRSGSHLGRFKSIIYHCIFVDALKAVPAEIIISQLESKATNANKPAGWPENYVTCSNAINILKDAVVGVLGQTRGAWKDRGSKCNSATGGYPSRHGISGGSKETGKKEEDLENQQLEGKRRAGFPDDESNHGADKNQQLFPPNNTTIFELVKLVSKGMLIILGLGSNEITKLREKRQKHTWSLQILRELLGRASTYEYEDDGTEPLRSTTQAEEETKASDFNPYQKGETNAEDGTKEVKKDGEKTTILVSVKNINGSTNIVQKIQEQFPVAIHDTSTQKSMLLAVENMQENITAEMNKETPILIAAKNGITEIVERILQLCPVAIHDTNSDKKNIVLLAVENRQPHVYELLLKITTMKDSVFLKVDNKGNSALHLAATLGEHKPWLISGAALQMQWELKWYEYVKDSMPFHFFVRHNKENKIPRDILTETHKDIVKAGGEWLTSTSESCSVVAALIATVAFATSTTVPGGVNSENGTPTLENEPAFNVFAISSLVALCFSVTAVVMFLSILTSRHEEKDFSKDLPRKLLVGLTSLFVSIASMLLSFCAGHFLVLKDKLKYAAFPVYAVTCLPVTFFAISQFPLYFDLIWATFKKLPQRSYKSISL